MTTDTTPQDTKARLMRRASRASVAAALVLGTIKLAAYIYTDSIALLSSLIDSLLDLAASTLTLFAVRQALLPADDEHRFGHGKLEALAGLSQAAFIAGSALFLVFEAGHRLLEPRVVQHAGAGLAVMLVSILVTVLLVGYQRYVVRRTGSLAIGADRLHYVSDLLVNLGIIGSLLCGLWLDWVYADPIIGIAITLYILYNAWEIARMALDQLMDRELPDTERERIAAIVRAHPAVQDLHDLRTRIAGPTAFIQLHLELPPSITLLRAHAISDEVEADIRRVYPHAEVIIHEDPAGVAELRSTLD